MQNTAHEAVRENFEMFSRELIVEGLNIYQLWFVVSEELGGVHYATPHRDTALDWVISACDETRLYPFERKGYQHIAYIPPDTSAPKYLIGTYHGLSGLLPGAPLPAEPNEWASMIHAWAKAQKSILVDTRALAKLVAEYVLSVELRRQRVLELRHARDWPKRRLIDRARELGLFNEEHPHVLSPAGANKETYIMAIIEAELPLHELIQQIKKYGVKPLDLPSISSLSRAFD